MCIFYCGCLYEKKKVLFTWSRHFLRSELAYCELMCPDYSNLKNFGSSKILLDFLKCNLCTKRHRHIDFTVISTLLAKPENDTQQ